MFLIELDEYDGYLACEDVLPDDLLLIKLDVGDFEVEFFDDLEFEEALPTDLLLIELDADDFEDEYDDDLAFEDLLPDDLFLIEPELDFGNFEEEYDDDLEYEDVLIDERDDIPFASTSWPIINVAAENTSNTKAITIFFMIPNHFLCSLYYFFESP